MVFHQKWLDHISKPKPKKEYGFLAMEYGQVELEKLVKAHIKPVVLKTLGYEIYDMRDRPRAGVIDNTMREKIIKSKFVIADLTHDNNGAYWEAGFAEALKKPVIYICEEEKFEKMKTHFDTNHCHTACWSMKETSKFDDELERILLNSLSSNIS